MPKLTIDGHAVEVASGETVLDAARKLGLDIPTLCYLKQYGAMTSCLVCVVKVKNPGGNGNGRVVPSCATRAQDGMIIESETAEIRDLRRSALELLLSDHVGDCHSPCHRICPLDLNIPRMIRQIQDGTQEQAIATVRSALPLPGVLGRLCHAPCENGCRRGSCDGPAAIRDLERFVADRDRETGRAFLPPRKPPTGKRVAIVGAGPAGLAAACHLLRQGHSCTVFDRHDTAGGKLRTQPQAQALPPEVLEFEIRQIAELGAVFQLNAELGATLSLAELREQFDAVLLALGSMTPEIAAQLGLATTAHGLRINPATYVVEAPNLFGAGSVVRPIKQVVRAMAEGQAAAGCLHQFLAGHPFSERKKAFSSIMGRIEKPELPVFLKGASAAPPTARSLGPQAGFTPDEAKAEAGRCLHCDCRAAGNCSLQEYATIYGANPTRFARERRRFAQQWHPGNVLFEPGKCIVCGICIEIARRAAEPLGLTFIGRGFDVRVGAPLDRPLAEGLQKVAAECVAHCPTGALAFR